MKMTYTRAEVIAILERTVLEEKPVREVGTTVNVTKCFGRLDDKVVVCSYAYSDLEVAQAALRDMALDQRKKQAARRSIAVAILEGCES
jgi:hypothetical protein